MRGTDVIPPDALDLLDWPSLITLALAGTVFGFLVVWQAPTFRAGSDQIAVTTVLAVAFSVVFFTFLITLRAYSAVPHWGRTFSTAIQGVDFALGIGVGLMLRRRSA